MSTLTSSSTLAQIVAAYVDNASYEEDASTTKAAAFISACRIILIKRPKKAAVGGEEIELDLELIARELDSARRWLATNGSVAAGGGGVKAISFEGFRV